MNEIVLGMVILAAVVGGIGYVIYRERKPIVAELKEDGKELREEIREDLKSLRKIRKLIRK